MVEPAASARARPRLRAAMLATSLLAALAFVATPASSQGGFVVGAGDVKAEFLRVGPKTAGLNSGVIVGQTLADYQNSVARAQSRAVDTTIYGTSLVAEKCAAYGETALGPNPISDEMGTNPSAHHEDLPTTVRVDSREEGAAEGETDYWPILPRDLTYHFADAKEENGGFPNVDPGPDSPGRADVSRLYAEASSQPASRATSDSASAYIVGVATVTGGHTETAARLDGTTRIAEGTVTIPEISLGGGAVVLRDLEWHAAQTTGPNAPADVTYDAGYRIGSITIGGTTYAMPPEASDEFDAQARALLRLVNAALAPSGLVVELPTVRQDNEHATVGPLSIRVDRPSLGREAFALLPKPVYDAREALFGAMLANECNLAAVVALGDITLATPAGAGATVVELGGVDAFTDGTDYVNPFADQAPRDFGDFDLPGPTTDPAPPTETPQVLGTGVSGGTTGDDPAGDPVPEVSYRDDQTSLAAGNISVPGSKSGTAAVVGLLGLVAVLGLAALDVFRPRRLAAMAAVVDEPPGGGGGAGGGDG